MWYKYLSLQNIPAWCKIFIWAIFNDITDIFICCTSVWQSTFVKAGYIIHVMTSAVKDKWGVDSSINLSSIKAPVQYKRKPLKHLMIKNRDAYEIRVITKLPNSEQSYKGKVKAHNYINRQPENCENRNDPDLVQAFLKKWWVESDFKAPNLPLSLRFKGSGCHCNSI